MHSRPHRFLAQAGAPLKAIQSARLSRSLRVPLIVAALSPIVLAGAAFAQASDIPSRSFVTPFPKNDVYRVRVYGDSWADGLINAVRRSLSADARLQVVPDVVRIRSLTRANWDRAVTEVESLKPSDAPEIAIVMTGAYDNQGLRRPGSRRIRLSDEAWRPGYGERVDRLMRAFRQKKIAVYWVGQPITRKTNRRATAQLINEIVRGVASRNRVKFIDTYDSFADESGNYSDYGPDLEGKVRRMRWKDGLHFMTAGYDKIAHFVEREIKRDLRLARSERSVALLGDETAQKQIKRVAKTRAPQASTWSTLLTPFLGGAARKSVEADQAAVGSQGLAAATSEVAVPLSGAAAGADTGAASQRGRRRAAVPKIKLKIERPAISATVLSLVRQRATREKKATFGDRVVLNGPDGRPVLGSVTPASKGSFDLLRSRSAPTQTAIFKVWAKGERLAPRDNRADDAAWPRPQPVVLIKRNDPAQPEVQRLDPLVAFNRLKVAPTPVGPPLPTRNPRAF
ncbi:MAG: GDSL-type esterase/lipase family protein [Pseudomonadota bacterium]